MERKPGLEELPVDPKNPCRQCNTLLDGWIEKIGKAVGRQYPGLLAQFEGSHLTLRCPVCYRSAGTILL